MGINVNVKVNPAYLPYMNKPQFLQIFYGGSSSGKSFFIADKIVLDNLSGCNWLCCRNVGNTIKRSIFNEVSKSITNMGLREYYSINKSDMIITCKLNERQILFCGLDDPEKVKSITPANGVLERIFIEEATEIKREAYLQLKKRLRGKTKHSKHILMAFNPILKSHWIYKDFFGGWQDNKSVYEDDKTLIVKTTYKDNIFLTPEDRALLEDETDPYFYNVYTLGNWGIIGNLIFTNWRVEDLSDRKDKFDNIFNGLDFGYTNPNAFIRVHVDEKNKKIYVLDEMYKRGQTYEQLASELSEKIGSEYITCDNEDGRAIFTLGSYGLRAIPAKKGPDSVLFGINWLKGYEIIIDISCQNFKNEIQAYHWDEDKNGNVLERPVKKNDHLLDALRYATESVQVTNRAKVGDIRW